MERVLAQAALVLVVLVFVLPFLFMLRVSLASAQAYLAGLQVWLSPIVFDNFSDVLTSTNFLYYLVNSLIMSVLTTLLVIVIGSMAGFGLAKMSAGFRDNIMFFVLSTRMGPAVVFALPFFLLMTSAGLIDTYIGLLVIYVFANLAFAIWLMYGFFQDVPPDVEQAAMLDGLGPWGVFRHIAVPMVATGLIAAAIFVFIFAILTRTRAGLIIQASLTHPNMVAMLGHNVPRVFMIVFGIGCGLAALAGVIAGPVLGTFPGMAEVLGSVVFVVVVVGGLGSLSGAFVASLLIGIVQTFAVALNVSVGNVLMAAGVPVSASAALHDVWKVTVAQVAPILPYVLLVVVLMVRPTGLFGTRET